MKLDISEVCRAPLRDRESWGRVTTVSPPAVSRPASRLSQSMLEHFKNIRARGKSWRDGLEVLIFRCMAGGCQIGWPIE
jgi:hypothetical protein